MLRGRAPAWLAAHHCRNDQHLGGGRIERVEPLGWLARAEAECNRSTGARLGEDALCFSHRRPPLPITSRDAIAVPLNARIAATVEYSQCGHLCAWRVVHGASLAAE